MTITKRIGLSCSQPFANWSHVGIITTQRMFSYWDTFFRNQMPPVIKICVTKQKRFASCKFFLCFSFRLLTDEQRIMSNYPEHEGKLAACVIKTEKQTAV